MTHEELAQKIKAGDKEQLGPLWEGTKRLLFSLAAKEMRSDAMRARAQAAGLEPCDIEQELFFALVAAVKAYDPARGYRFTSYLKYAVKNRLQSALGLRTEKQKYDPLCRADSLDRQIEQEDGETSLSDIVPDPQGETGFLNVEDAVFVRQLHEALETALNDIEPPQKRVIVGRYFQGQTLKALAESEGCSLDWIRQREAKALVRIRWKHGRLLRPFLDEMIEAWAYRGTGLKAFRYSGVSSVERAAEKIDTYKRKDDKP
ncbi:sigma-70 family RNA polymerase sigma factor [Zongyangia sp. HA2173]|uniref:RNA polymerase sigma factor n=1 Tax=Zongyangia sp. HA2173 TaxID=3133035 RepID=UPI00315E1560